MFFCNLFLRRRFQEWIASKYKMDRDRPGQPANRNC